MTAPPVPSAGRRRPAPQTPEDPRLGALLRARGALSAEALADALESQRTTRRRLGEILLASGASDERAVAEAIARQRGLDVVDPDADPPDPALAADADAHVYAGHGLLPWRRERGTTVVACADPDRAIEGLRRLADPPRHLRLAVAPRSGLERAIGRVAGPALADRAAARTPEAFSVRGMDGLRRTAALAFAGLVLAVILGGAPAATLGLLALLGIDMAATAMRLAVLLAGRRGRPRAAPAPPGAIDMAARRPAPRVSILVPLYREAGMIGQIVRALERLDYPRELLDVRLLLEESDTETRAAVAAAALPGWIRPLVVPEGRPRTKPRAMNYALDFCEGEIVGILDAEDRPAPGQVRAVVETLAAAPPEVACVQCELTYYNPRENWIARLFQVEYGLWFAVLLHGFEALGLAIPLGGTSCYFRRGVLDEVGAWDAQNVTEDADLGMRLARAGHRSVVLDVPTEEEANCRAAAWIRQRSRWLKGYLLTLLSHMRAPRRLWRDLGPRAFLGLNALFLGAVATFLAMPLFWMACLGWLATGESVLAAAVPGWMLWPAAVCFALGQAVLVAAAAVAMRRRGMPGLLLWLPLAPVYWTLGAVAAWKAMAEMAVAPCYWDKTSHGVSRAAGGAGAAPQA